MNYIHHAFIGVGTAALAVIAAETLGASQIPAVALGLGAVIDAAGSIATDLDHPRSFISHSIPSQVVRIALAVLALPTLVALGVLLTIRDVSATWNELSSMVLGIAVLRWSFFALLMALGLMGISWVVYRSLHHRGPLHSLLFAGAVTIAAIIFLAAFRQPWYWGLAFGWGWLWHILADGLTKEGVPFFWPFSDEHRNTLPVWACGASRLLLSLAAILGIVGLIFLRLRPSIG